LEGAKIISCQKSSISEGHSIDIYFKKGDDFYFMRLSPKLDLFNNKDTLSYLYNKKNRGELIYKNKKITGRLLEDIEQIDLLNTDYLNLPIFEVTKYFKIDNTKVKIEGEILGENEDKKQFNFMNRPHTFPAMVMKAQPNELDEE
jgi:hypothetical protein